MFNYLDSAEALDSLSRNVYWPKWHSPWWHMLLWHEMGDACRIPAQVVERLVSELDRSPREDHCHCALGNIYQVLASWGVDVDRELPWIRPWFLGCQMADGGLNCDLTAYEVEDECPSSMVATMAAFEAVLLYTSRPWTPEEVRFLECGAAFLIDRALMRGSSTRHNREEREAAAGWLKPCFPRFYKYDVLRGLHALLLWAEKTGGAVPPEAVAPVVGHLEREFPDGRVRNQRHSYEGVATRAQLPDGSWTRTTATLFPLLEEVSALGEVSPYLTRQWSEARQRLAG